MGAAGTNEHLGTGIGAILDAATPYYYYITGTNKSIIPLNSGVGEYSSA